MTVLTTIPNGALNKDIRDTINALLADVAALKAGGGTVTPTPTINNTSSNSSLLPTQVAGAHDLYVAREAAGNDRETRITALENA